MQVKCAHTKIVDLDLLQPHPKNPNKHPENQIKLLAKIMKHQGWRNPVTVSKRSGFVVAGHGRIEAARLNGWTEAPVDEQDFDTEADEYAHLIADNKIQELAEPDDEIIQEIALDLGPDFDFDLFGIEDFKVKGVDTLPPGAEDQVPEPPVEPTSKLGQIYKLGRHRLMCGDATKDVEELLDGEKVDMVFTDPPYGMGLDTDYSKMGSSSLKHEQGLVDEFNPEMIRSILSINCDEVFIFGADYFAELLPDRNKGSWVVWDKRSDGDKIGILDNAFGSDFEMCWSKSKHKRLIARVLRQTGAFSSRGDDKVIHPTQKPIALVEWYFNRWGKNTAAVADLFGGSGSTLIACEKTGRTCYMMEIEPRYVDVIIKRWQTYTGKKAELIKDV